MGCQSRRLRLPVAVTSLPPTDESDPESKNARAADIAAFVLLDVPLKMEMLRCEVSRLTAFIPSLIVQEDVALYFYGA